MFDSKYEIIFYKYLEANNVMFEYHPNICFEYVYDGKTHVYYPDFLVNGELIEIKGLQFFENRDANCKMINPFNREQDALYEAKHQCMLSHNVKIITDISLYT